MHGLNSESTFMHDEYTEIFFWCLEIPADHCETFFKQVNGRVCGMNLHPLFLSFFVPNSIRFSKTHILWIKCCYSNKVHNHIHFLKTYIHTYPYVRMIMVIVDPRAHLIIHHKVQCKATQKKKTNRSHAGQCETKKWTVSKSKCHSTLLCGNLKWELLPYIQFVLNTFYIWAIFLLPVTCIHKFAGFVCFTLMGLIVHIPNNIQFSYNFSSFFFLSSVMFALIYCIWNMARRRSLQLTT